VAIVLPTNRFAELANGGKIAYNMPLIKVIAREGLFCEARLYPIG
jgi:hypothetical protein